MSPLLTWMKNKTPYGINGYNGYLGSRRVFSIRDSMCNVGIYKMYCSLPGASGEGLFDGMDCGTDINAIMTRCEQIVEKWMEDAGLEVAVRK